MHKMILTIIVTILFAGVTALPQSARATTDGGAIDGWVKAAETPSENDSSTEKVQSPYQPRIMGDVNAPVTIYEYSSLTCPHCAEFHANIMPELKKRYIDPGYVKLEMRDFPLDNRALEASMIGRCVPQDTYFQFIETLFQSQKNWAVARNLLPLRQMARLTGISNEAITTCLADIELRKSLIAGTQDAIRTYQISSTPSFVINGEHTLKGVQSIDEFARILDQNPAIKMQIGKDAPAADEADVEAETEQTDAPEQK